jgi:hypothetical protein
MSNACDKLKHKQPNGQTNKNIIINTTTTKPLIPNKLGYARNETQSKIIDLKEIVIQIEGLH